MITTDDNITTQLAHIIYTDYCAAVGGKAYNGDDLPTAEEFFKDASKKKQSTAWIAAAASAIAWFPTVKTVNSYEDDEL